MSHYRYIVSAVSAIGVLIAEEALGGIATCMAIREFERLGSTNITVKRKHDDAPISLEEIKALETEGYRDWRASM